jgi:hypothetical protein
MATAEAWDFFIAYASADRARADKLHALLAQKHDARSFLDHRGLKPGDEWQVELKRSLSRSRVIVVLISPNSNEAYYQQEEVAIAVDLVRLQTKAHRIVPVLLRGAERTDLLYGLNHLHALEEREDGLVRVAERLAALLEKTDTRAPTVALAHASQLVDELWSRAEGAYTGHVGRVPEEYRMRYAADAEDIVGRSHGHEQQRITRSEFERRLTLDQLRYVSVLEKSMEVNLALWERTYPNRTLDPKSRKEADQAIEAMAEDLSGVLNLLERSGLWLDDHYLAVRQMLDDHLPDAGRRPAVDS